MLFVFCICILSTILVACLCNIIPIVIALDVGLSIVQW